MHPEFTTALLDAMTQREPLTIRYTDAEGAESERLIRPHLIQTRPNGVTYVEAVDLEKSQVRSFRLDRMRIVRTEVSVTTVELSA